MVYSIPTSYSELEGTTVRVSAKEQYGLRAMAELARQYGTGPVSLSTVSEAQGISLDYLEQIVPALRDERHVALAVHVQRAGLPARRHEQAQVVEDAGLDTDAAAGALLVVHDDIVRETLQQVVHSFLYSIAPLGAPTRKSRGPITPQSTS